MRAAAEAEKARQAARAAGQLGCGRTQTPEQLAAAQAQKAATHNESPLPFIAEHADRIPHIHVKDRRFGRNGGENQPFGEGETAVRETLQTIPDKEWSIRTIIEFEDGVPEGSTRQAEIKKAVAYCRAALLG